MSTSKLLRDIYRKIHSAHHGKGSWWQTLHTCPPLKDLFSADTLKGVCKNSIYYLFNFKVLIKRKTLS